MATQKQKDVNLLTAKVTSEKHLAANQKNALKSTGPKSESGKLIVSKNAMRHGILSKEVFIDEGMKADFLKLKEGFYLQFNPQGELESFLLDRVISCAWRLALLTRVEAQIYGRVDTVSHGEDPQIKSAFFSTARAMTLVHRYEVSIERNFYRALTELQHAQSMRTSSRTIENGFVSQIGEN